MMKRTCKNCAYWDQSGKTWKVGEEQEGLCRINFPAVIFSNHPHRIETVWPKTKPEDWCGKWYDREDPFAKDALEE